MFSVPNAPPSSCWYFPSLFLFSVLFFPSSAFSCYWSSDSGSLAAPPVSSHPPLLLFPRAHSASFLLISFASLLLSLLNLLFFDREPHSEPNLKVTIHQHAQASTSSRYCYCYYCRQKYWRGSVHTVIILLLRGEHQKWSTAELQFAMHPGKFDDLTENKEPKPSL